MLDFLVQKVYAVDTVNAGAQNVSSGTAFDSLLTKILANVVNPLIYLIMAVAVIYFLWGVVVFIKNADNAEKRAEGSQSMIWGLLGLFIMLSAKGIIVFILSTMGLK